VRIAIPLFGTRVAPRCTGASRIMVAVVEDGEVISRSIYRAGKGEASELLDFISEHQVETIICGAARSAFKREAAAMGVNILTDESGESEEVLARFLERPASLAEEEQDGPSEEGTGVLDCTTCTSRICLTGGNCMPGKAGLISLPQEDSLKKKIEVSGDVSMEQDRNLCRIAELVYFGLGMEYKHIGVAFCVDLFHETEILTSVLKRFFEVSAVCCKVGGLSPEETGLEAGEHGIICNAPGQAEILNAAGTDLNVVVGLCVGCDTIFGRMSDAPVTTLFVKDRMLANNPVSALYSRYYMETLAADVKKGSGHAG